MLSRRFNKFCGLAMPRLKVPGTQSPLSYKSSWLGV